MDNDVNHPKHYTTGKIEVIDFIEDKNLNYHRGNAVKYIVRAGIKDQAKEAEQAERAVERLLDALDHGARCPTPDMYLNCCEYNAVICRACRKAWAMKEGE